MRFWIANWRDGWRFLTVWVFVFIAALPDLLPLVEATGLLQEESLPSHVGVILRTVAVVGIFTRFINQNTAAKKVPE